MDVAIDGQFNDGSGSVMNEMATEILVSIFMCLYTRHLMTLKLVNRRFKDIIDNNDNEV